MGYDFMHMNHFQDLQVLMNQEIELTEVAATIDISSLDPFASTIAKIKLTNFRYEQNQTLACKVVVRVEYIVKDSEKCKLPINFSIELKDPRYRVIAAAL